MVRAEERLKTGINSLECFFYLVNKKDSTIYLTRHIKKGQEY